ncbi:MAG: ATP-dependent Clp protease adaptor ClpS [Deltaproteobacteria bacterium]|jgi:ATP-dependent Clp protease adaptor protein ClpS|nr:ATP-dependent Clp protease adaptor ClpS [Deltaproteobacteria bacterium]
MPKEPGGPSGGDPRQDRQGGVAEKTRKRAVKPPQFKVLLYNDDYTPMGFVVALLESVFRRSPAESNALMLKIHRSGSGIAGVYTLEVAETKVATVHNLAEENGYPLRAGVLEE